MRGEEGVAAEGGGSGTKLSADSGGDKKDKKKEGGVWGLFRKAPMFRP